MRRRHHHHRSCFSHFESFSPFSHFMFFATLLLAWLCFGLSIHSPAHSRSRPLASCGLWKCRCVNWSEFQSTHISKRERERKSDQKNNSKTHTEKKNLDVFRTLNVGMIMRLYTRQHIPNQEVVPRDECVYSCFGVVSVSFFAAPVDCQNCFLP